MPAGRRAASGVSFAVAAVVQMLECKEKREQSSMPLDISLPAPVGIATWKRAAVALALGAAIIAVAQWAGVRAITVFDVWANLDGPRAFAAGEIPALLTARVSVSLFAFQAVTIVLVLTANALALRRGAPFLDFGLPRGGFRVLFGAVSALAIFALCYGSVVYAFDGQAFRHDMEPFAGLMQSRTWWLVLIAAGIGAPLAEECLFRGLLFGAFKSTPVGLAGAAVITAAMWALMHANYSVYGITAITLIGIYLAVIREKTGTLLAPIVCHGTYNSLIVLIMAFAPNSAFAG